ncbi:MAG TPA: hypothetical protein VJS11_05720 [Acidobacteriaceae bacterium]|nr:hypothetical protein [Acidobacteriaceae bacterium]
MAHLQDLLNRSETLLVVLVLASLIRSGYARRFPALTTYLGIRVFFGTLLTVMLLTGRADYRQGYASCLYFITFWTNYVACAVATFFVCQEVFKKVMEPVPGLRRLGLVAFRWVCAVIMLVGLAVFAIPSILSAPGTAKLGHLMVSVSLDFGRCVSVLQLCLLLFVAFSIHALGRTFRSRLFGIALGFGIQAGSDLITFALLTRYPGHLENTINLVFQITITAVLLLWTGYFLIPEPAVERRQLVLAPTSVVARWNGLASGIGQAPTLAPATTPTGFFLQDIEGVVDRVLARNPVAVSGR